MKTERQLIKEMRADERSYSYIGRKLGVSRVRAWQLDHTPEPDPKSRRKKPIQQPESKVE